MALTDKLTAIANAIRAKTGKSDSLTLDQMPTEIANITGGGGGSSADVRYVTFTNASTGETFVKPVIKGDDCVDVVAKGLWAKPTQESTAQYDYAFDNSWSATPNGSADANILKNITEDKTVYAVFTATLRKYTITWLDEDGTELPGQKQWAYGTVPSYTPGKEDFTFDGWIPEVQPVTGNASYTAQWIGKPELATTSWEKISEMSANGTAANYFAVGDTKPVLLSGTVGTLSLNTTLNVYILGFNHNSEREGTGIHFGCFKTSDGKDVALVDSMYDQQMKSSYGTSGKLYLDWNHKNISYGGWKASDIRYDILGSTNVAPSSYGTGTNESTRVGYDATATCATSPKSKTLMSCLPQELRAVLKPITKWSSNVNGGGTSVEDHVTASVDYLPLLSLHEVGLSQSACNTYESNYQQTYAYFAEGNSKLKYKHSDQATACKYWLRSQSTEATGLGVAIIAKTGSASNTSKTYSLGVAPIFMV